MAERGQERGPHAAIREYPFSITAACALERSRGTAGAGLGACPSNDAPTAGPPHRHLSTIISLTWCPPCARNDRGNLLDVGRPRYGDHYSDRLLELIRGCARRRQRVRRRRRQHGPRNCAVCWTDTTTAITLSMIRRSRTPDTTGSCSNFARSKLSIRSC